MQERYLGRIEPGMDVCDINGDKIGSVDHVYRYASAPATPVASTDMDGSSSDDEIVEVKTGFFGLGKHYYVPLAAVHDVTSNALFLSEGKEHVDEMGWDMRPDRLDEMT